MYQYKYFYIILGCMVASLGGVFLSIGHLNFCLGNDQWSGLYSPGSYDFRKMDSFWLLAALVLFGITDALQMRLQALGILPSQIILLYRMQSPFCFSWFRWTFHRSVQLQTLYKTIDHLSSCSTRCK